MFNYIVMEAVAGTIKGWGEKSFRATPTKGDYISTTDKDGIGQAYVVLGVLHPMDGAPSCGDLFIQHVGSDLDLRGKMKLQVNG